MRTLEPPDTHYVNAAIGWLELGNPLEARQELRGISSAALHLPEVLDVRWQICAAELDWAGALATAREIVRRAPHLANGWVNQSYSLHELKRTREAWEELRPLVKKFPDNSTIPYNLACYACQLGDLPSAREWLHRAAEIRGKDEIKKMALADTDLDPLRAFVQGL